MSYCGNCGNKLEAGAKFCGVCGAAVPEDVLDSNTTNKKAKISERLINATKNAKTKLRSKLSSIGGKWASLTDAQKNRWLIVGGFVLICLTIIIVNSNNSPNPQPQQYIQPQQYVQPQPYVQQTSKSQPKADPLVTCPGCNGQGYWHQNFSKVNCSICYGKKMVKQSEAEQFNAVVRPIIDQYGLPMPGNGGGTSSNEKDCWNCHGSGKCSSCAGRGEYNYSGSYGQRGGKMDCSTCHGSGKCQVCYGRGKR